MESKNSVSGNEHDCNIKDLNNHIDKFVSKHCCEPDANGNSNCSPFCCSEPQYFPPVLDCTHTYEEKLHVVVPISNYHRYKSRYRLFLNFKREIEKNPFAVLYIVEVALGDRPFAVTEHNNPRHLQLRTKDEIWQKERSVNLMVQRFPANWRYMAIVDGDIIFNNKNFAQETIHELQHTPICQMFQNVVNLGPAGEIDSTYPSFAFQYFKNPEYVRNNKLKKYHFPHPGFAWAMTKECFNALGGLFDVAILGSGDHHMAYSLIGRADVSLPVDISASYRKAVKEYEDRCNRFVKGHVGYVKGMIMHQFHGKFKDRKYQERWSILISNKFDPYTDLKPDWSGLYQIDVDKPQLSIDIRNYMKNRNEDSIDNDK
jgi:hypothetical protein